MPDTITNTTNEMEKRLEWRDELLRSNAEQIKNLKQWVADLQSNMYVNCVYCGHRFGEAGKVPVAMSEVLKEHVEECNEHPMSKLKVAARGLVEQLDKANAVDETGHLISRLKALADLKALL